MTFHDIFKMSQFIPMIIGILESVKKIFCFSNEEKVVSELADPQHF